MPSMKISGCRTFDYCFCKSDCTNVECDRCMMYHYNNMREYNNKYPYYPHSESDFHLNCDDYIKPLIVLDRSDV